MCLSISVFLATSLAVVLLTFSSSPNTVSANPSSSSENFTIVALPDTQYYSQNYPSVFTSQTNWIVNNENALNIVFVTHLGDIVNVNNDDAQWQRANTSMSVLDNKVPYTVLPGNHDMDEGYSPPPGAGATYYERYFPASRYENYPYWGGSYDSNTVTSSSPNMNNYVLFSAGGMNFILLSLQYNPTADVLSWADNVLSEYSNRRAIISTHSYLLQGGSLTGNGGLQIYNNVVVPENNVFLVLCGHMFNNGTMTWNAVNLGGRVVYQLLSDYQDLANGGNGYLRIMKFVPSENTIYVSTYSPSLNQYLTDYTNQFPLYYPMATAGGVSVSITPGSRKGLDGVTLNYHVTVNNNENVSDNYSLTVNDNSGWSPSVSPTTLVVPSLGSGTVTLSVTIPENAIGGTIDSIWVKATSNYNVSIFDNESCLAQVTIVRGFSVSISPSSQSGENGATLMYTVAVNNIGIISDNYFLTVNDNSGWSPSVSPTSLPNVSPGSSGNATLSVTVGMGTDAITVKVTNDNTTGQATTNEATCTATGLPISVSFTPGVQYGWPGENLVYTVVVKNLENTADNYQLTFFDTQPWQAGWNPPTGGSAPPLYISTKINDNQDSDVKGYSPSTNYGSNYNMYVGIYNSSPAYSYVQWNLSSIPANAIIDNAYVYMTGAYGPSWGYPNYYADNMWVEVWNVNNDTWNQNTITWLNNPGYGPTLLDNELWVAYTWAGAYSWVSWNVTSWVQHQLENNKLASFAFMSNGIGEDGQPGNDGWFQTGDNNSTLFIPEYVPYLLVNYHAPAYILSLGPGENWTGTVWAITGASGIDGNTVTATSMTDNTITASATAQAIANAASVSENIVPPAIAVTTPGTYNFTVTVTNLGGLPDSFKLAAIDNENWQPTLVPNTLGPLAAGGSENATLSVTVPSGAKGGTIDRIIVTATSQTDNKVSDSENCTASVFNSFGNIRLATGSPPSAPFLWGIRKVKVTVNIQVSEGDNLHLIFLKDDNKTVDSDSVIWSRTAPGTQTITLTNLIVPHDNNLTWPAGGSPAINLALVGSNSASNVFRIKLVLTDNSGAVILDNMAWYTVVQDDWSNRISWIILNWGSHNSSQQDQLSNEISSIIIGWGSVPTSRDQHDFSQSF
jgi:hypothetical protein